MSKPRFPKRAPIRCVVFVIFMVPIVVKTWQGIPFTGNSAVGQEEFSENDVKTSLDGSAVSIVLGPGFTITSNKSSWRTYMFVRVSSRHLLALANCTPRAVEQFPRDPFTQEQRQNGAVIVHISIALYMFIGFSLICDDYFVPSLELICDVLHINSDVAGATFMAAGSSAPELATSVIAVFIAKNDIGLGTVVGSAVYNVMFVISICAMCAGMVVYLNVWPLIRDSAFYALSVAALSITIVDESVYWYEALALVCLYLLYIIMMYFNTPLEAWVLQKFSCCRINSQTNTETENIVLYDKMKNGHTENGAIQSNVTDTDCQVYRGATEGISLDESDDDDDDDDMSDRKLLKKLHVRTTDDPKSALSYPDVCWKKAVYIVAFPIKLLLFISIPDCRQKRWQRCYFVTFIMSLVWLSAFSYLMVWMITTVGYTINIPDSIMTLTIVAFGVSLPDVIASLIVVRDGYGDMAVSNAVGSNVFDILICLGVPWLLQTLITNPGQPVQVYSQGLVYASMTLLLTVVFLIAATHLNGWKLTKKYGVILMIVYILFTVLSVLYELNIFSYVHPEECPTNY